MDAKLLKAITDLTAAIDRNTRQIERSDPNSYINRMSGQIRSVFENLPQNQEQDQKSTA
ncbi:hypothetical protein ACQKFE_22510 [Stutzerimonas stutzeri]|jgi:hypothetical protein|uniref:hypothetical protein n=1 Tax=Bacteria TaxID=2 RepID=UPI000B1A3943